MNIINKVLIAVMVMQFQAYSSDSDSDSYPTSGDLSQSNVPLVQRNMGQRTISEDPWSKYQGPSQTLTDSTEHKSNLDSSTPPTQGRFPQRTQSTIRQGLHVTFPDIGSPPPPDQCNRAYLPVPNRDEYPIHYGMPKRTVSDAHFQDQNQSAEEEEGSEADAKQITSLRNGYNPTYPKGDYALPYHIPPNSPINYLPGRENVQITKTPPPNNEEDQFDNWSDPGDDDISQPSEFPTNHTPPFAPIPEHDTKIKIHNQNSSSDEDLIQTPLIPTKPKSYLGSSSPPPSGLFQRTHSTTSTTTIHSGDTDTSKGTNPGDYKLPPRLLTQYNPSTKQKQNDSYSDSY